jgi:hypothetical protein
MAPTQIGRSWSLDREFESFVVKDAESRQLMREAIPPVAVDSYRRMVGDSYRIENVERFLPLR